MLEDKTLEKIIKFFDEINCPIKKGLKKIPANGEENTFLGEYAVIYNGQDIMLGNKKNKKFAFEERNDVDLNAYCGEYFPNPERLLNRLKKGGYELIYCNNKQV